MSGKYFEELNVGEKLTTRSRIVTETDIELFTDISGCRHSVFLSEEFARKMGLKTRVAPGFLTFSIAAGLLMEAGLIEQTIVFLGMDKVSTPNPVYPHDSIRCEFEVISKRETKKDDRGIIKYKITLRNQEDQVVGEAELTELFLRKQPRSQQLNSSKEGAERC